MKKFIALTIACICCFGAVFAQSQYYSGDGRKDLSIEVDVPKLSGNLTTESTWIPDFVVNMLCDDIAKYSAITVVDTNNLDRVIEAQKRSESGLYNEDEVLELGNLSVAKNLLIINITAKSTSYAVSLKVNNKETNTSLAAFNEPNCSVTDLENGIVLKKAVADLLGQLGVNLTDEGKKSLTDVATQTSTIEAQRNIAKGTAAMQSGSSIEALSYFVKAKNSDNNLKRASVAMSKAGTVVATTDFASNVRNVIKMRKDFIALVDETTSYLNENFPYSVVYSKELSQGDINYEKETFEMLFRFTPLTNFEARELVQNIYEAYLTMPNHEDWGISDKINGMIPRGYLRVTFDAKDKNGKTIGEVSYDRPINGYDVTRYAYRNDSSADVRQGAFEISAEEDTSTVTYGIKSVLYSASSYRFSDAGAKQVSITCATFPDYLDSVILPAAEMTEIMSDVWVPTISRGLNIDTYNNVLKKFGYDLTMQKISEQVATGSYVDASTIVYRYSEVELRDAIGGGRYGYDLNKASKLVGRNIMSPQGQIIVTNNNKAFPRNKDAFVRVASTAIPLRFVKIPEAGDCLFLKNDKDTVFLLSYLGITLGTIGMEFQKSEYSNSQSARVSTLNYQNKGDGKEYDLKGIMQSYFGSIYPTITAIPQRNYYYYTVDGTRYTSYPDILGMEALVKHYSSQRISNASDGDVLNIAIKPIDMARIEVLSYAKPLYSNKKDTYFEVTEEFYNGVIEVAKKYRVSCTLPEYNTLPRKDWSVEFIRVLNKLTAGEKLFDSAKWLAVKDGDLKKLAKDPNGKRIADDMTANPNKLYVDYYGR